MGLAVYLTDQNKSEDEALYEGNITHNLIEMSKEAGIYQALWQPDAIGAKRAKDIIDPLELGLADMLDRPEHFQQFNSPNGWGVYEDFLQFIIAYLDACRQNPEAQIETGR